MLLEVLAEYGLFLAKVVTVVVALLFIAASVAQTSQRRQSQADGQITIKHLNDRYKAMKDSLREALLSPEQFKLEQKQTAREEKNRLKNEKKQLKKRQKTAAEAAPDDAIQRVYVLEFDGDMQASGVQNLREEITALLTIAGEQDEVVVKLQSPGGLVHGYGLAASQLARIKQRGIPLTVCVDKVAASGGYMMACIADKIVAAPFAVLGSIGVVAQIPNFHRVLKKHDVDVEVLTAGEYKRTLTLFGENTDKGRSKFIEELEQTHQLFKDWVAQNRTSLAIDEVATGETWYGSKAMEMNLIDELSTSDDYLTAKADCAELYQLKYEHKKTVQERLGLAAENRLDSLLLRWWQRFNSRWFS